MEKHPINLRIIYNQYISNPLARFEQDNLKLNPFYRNGLFMIFFDGIIPV